MATIKECDRCHRQVKQSMWNGQELSLEKGWEAELCSKCVSNVKEFIQSPENFHTQLEFKNQFARGYDKGVSDSESKASCDAS